MAEARCCDRCNRFYKNNNSTKRRGISVGGIEFVSASNRCYIPGSEIDLCDDCLKDLDSFFTKKDVNEVADDPK